MSLAKDFLEQLNEKAIKIESVASNAKGLMQAITGFMKAKEEATKTKKDLAKDPSDKFLQNKLSTLKLDIEEETGSILSTLKDLGKVKSIDTSFL